MDGLNDAIRRALSGDNSGREVLEFHMSEELGPSVTKDAAGAATVRRLGAIRELRALMKCETERRGDDVKPTADVNLNDATMWVMQSLSDRIIKQLCAARNDGSNEALVVGVVGSAGAGKSTIAQVLKLMKPSAAKAKLHPRLAVRKSPSTTS